MKKIVTLLALTISFSINAQINTNGTSNSGVDASAMGYYTTASGDFSTAMGKSTTASGVNSTAMGINSTASGDSSTAIGGATLASGMASTAIGANTTASGFGSTAIGYNSTASGGYSTAMGRITTASGFNSTAMGRSTIASDYASTVIGQHNSSGSSVTNSATSFNTANTAFVIGNGTASNAKSDAFKVMFNGDATLAGNLSVNSDARLKANIISLGSTLTKLLQIDGKSYTMKKDENNKQKIGVLAQDIEKVFPELVSESNGIKSVNYQGLVPVLINALKEQQSEIEILKQQQAEIDELKEMVQELVSRN